MRQSTSQTQRLPHAHVSKVMLSALNKLQMAEMVQLQPLRSCKGLWLVISIFCEDLATRRLRPEPLYRAESANS